MRNRNSNIVFIIIATLCMSCQDLGPRLFNPKALEAYMFESYDAGDQQLDSSYDLLEGELNTFNCQSNLNGDMATIFGVYLGDLVTIEQDTVILYCHGNAANMDVYFQRVKLLYNLNGKSNYGVCMFDYRGFGMSKGESTEAGLVADTEAVLAWLEDQGLQSDKLIIYGYSLGSIPAIAMCNSSQTKPSKLILESPIGSIDAMAKGGTGLDMPASFFADLQTNNIEAIKTVEQPLCWVHGVADDFLDIETHGLPIYNNYKGTYKEFLAVEDANHGDVPWILGLDNYSEAIRNFIVLQE